jgi:hypothetical protein
VAVRWAGVWLSIAAAAVVAGVAGFFIGNSAIDTDTMTVSQQQAAQIERRRIAAPAFRPTTWRRGAARDGSRTRGRLANDR